MNRIENYYTSFFNVISSVEQVFYTSNVYHYQSTYIIHLSSLCQRSIEIFFSRIVFTKEQTNNNHLIKNNNNENMSRIPHTAQIYFNEKFCRSIEKTINPIVK